MEKLADKGIRTLIHYPIPVHLQECYKELKYKKGDFSVAEKCCEGIMSLPMYPELTEEEIRYIITIFNQEGYKCQR